MSFRSDHVVVPFATFVERRERRNGIAATLRKRDQNDAAVKNSSALAVAMSVVGGHTTSAATGESECGADESVTVYSTDLRPERPKLAPR